MTQNGHFGGFAGFARRVGQSDQSAKSDLTKIGFAKIRFGQIGFRVPQIIILLTQNNYLFRNK